MYRIIPVVALALGMAVSVAAQDSTVTIENESQRRRCTRSYAHGLPRARARWFLHLNNATARSSDEVTTKSKVETDVDNHGDDVKTKSRTEVDHDDGHRAGVAGLKASYELTPNQGVDLASHVGQQVQITAVALDAKKGDDDAKVKIEDETKVDRENAPDCESEDPHRGRTASRRSLEGHGALRENRGSVVQPVSQA